MSSAAVLPPLQLARIPSRHRNSPNACGDIRTACRSCRSPGSAPIGIAHLRPPLNRRPAPRRLRCMTLADIAAGLYAVTPGEFVAERTRLAGEHPELAAEIRALRKPSVAAWVVNLFAAERADRLGQALELAQQLREAQEELDAAALAQFGRQRRALTAQLAREAVGLATDRGERVTPATSEAVQQTLTAAFFEPAAAAAVASGRLLRDLEPAAAIDLETAVAGGAPSAPRRRPRSTDEVGAQRRRREAERALRAAEKEKERAQRVQRQADRVHADAVTAAERLTARAAELEAELERTRVQADRATAEVADAETAQAEAADAVAAAEQALTDALTAREQAKT